MSKNVTVDLDEPITGHDGLVRKLVFRQPVLRDILKHGEPYTVHRDGAGQFFIVDDNDALAHYTEACLVHPVEFDIVQGQVGVSDSLKVRETIKGFFLRAGEARADSKTSQPTSSSSSGGKPTPSAA